jgi:hypothetical protein
VSNRSLLLLWFVVDAKLDLHQQQQRQQLLHKQQLACMADILLVLACPVFHTDK